MRRLVALACIVTLLGWSGPALADDPPWVRPEGPRWDRDDKPFAFSEEIRRGLSAIACPRLAGGGTTCLAVFDIGGRAQFVDIAGGGFVPQPGLVAILPDSMIADPEDKGLDAEGAAVDDTYYYVTGSHSPRRSNCKPNLLSRHVVRLPYDRQSGRPIEAERKVSTRLWPLMAELAELQDHVGDGKCMGKPDHAVDIEGLAIRDGRLYFGFRGPAVDRTAPILSVDAKALFEGGDLRPKVTMLEVGGGRGIRDLLNVADGILVLVGPDDERKNEDRDWFVGLWDPRTAELTPLARLDLEAVRHRDCDAKKDKKPEAIALLEESPYRYRLLVLSDSLCDGGPLSFTVPR